MKDIGVISPFRAQVELIKSTLADVYVDSHTTNGEKTKESRDVDRDECDVSTVDKFQGRDMDVIVLSMVKSSQEGKDSIGNLLRDWRRINVAVTRYSHSVDCSCTKRSLIRCCNYFQSESQTCHRRVSDSDAASAGAELADESGEREELDSSPPRQRQPALRHVAHCIPAQWSNNCATSACLVTAWRCLGRSQIVSSSCALYL